MQKSALEAQSRRFSIFSQGVSKSLREIRQKRNPKVAQRDALQSFDGSRADFVVENNSDKECLYDKLETLLIKLKQDL